MDQIDFITKLWREYITLLNFLQEQLNLIDVSLRSSFFLISNNTRDLNFEGEIYFKTLKCHKIY